MSRNRWVVVVATLCLGTMTWSSLPGEEPKDAKEAKPATKEKLPTKLIVRESSRV